MALAVTLLQAGLWALLAAASVHLLAAAVRAARLPAIADEPLANPPLPTVTVQLPIRNEGAIAVGAARAACALDWPAGKLEVQLLDDSDDGTSALLDEAAVELRAAGADVTVLRRGERRGWKAGNLQHGLAHARGEFVAVLDADARPPRDLLRKLVPPLLAEPSLGFAQGRWGFHNEAESLLTRIQAQILHALFLVEQQLLSARRAPLQFNGSGGVWRRAALEAAGGFLPSGGASLAEDLDVAWRARRRGFFGLARPGVVVDTELPSTMAAFRAQQKRWVRGGAEVLRATLRDGSPVALLGHLARHARQPYLVLLTAWLPLTTLDLVRPALAPAIAWPIVLALLWLAIGSYYAAARRRLGRSALGGFLYAPVVAALSLGLCPSLTLAFLRGLAGSPGEFERTPKRGEAARAHERARLDPLALVEVAVGVLYATLAVRAVSAGALGGALVLGGLFAGGYLWVGLGSLVDR